MQRSLQLSVLLHNSVSYLALALICINRMQPCGLWPVGTTFPKEYFIKSHRMIKVGRDLDAYPIPAPLPWADTSPPSQAVQGPVQPNLEHLQRERVPTTSLGSPCQGLTSFWVNNFLLMPSINIPSSSLKPFPLFYPCLRKKKKSSSCL